MNIDNFKKLLSLVETELLQVSKIHLMSLIALYIDLSRDDDNEGIIIYGNKLEQIFDKNLLDDNYYPQYKDEEIDKTKYYLWFGYLRDNNMSKNDLYVKQLVLENYLACFNDYVEIITKDEVENIYNNISKII